jgi:hypothetical protein
MSLPSWLRNESWGAAFGSVLLAPGSYFAFLWSHISFIPGTTQGAQAIGVVGTLAGFLPDGLLRSRLRDPRARLLGGLVTGVVFCIFFVSYNAYVLWATEMGYVSGLPVYVQDLVLLISTFSWSALWSMIGRSVWRRIPGFS